VFDRSKKAYPMLRYAWKDAKAALESLAADDAGLEQVQVTYTNPETGGDAENILGFYALMLRPGQTLRLAARSPAQVFHVIEGAVRAQIVASQPTRLPLHRRRIAPAPQTWRLREPGLKTEFTGVTSA
jgi:gentisate 1,2-dioxygenase